jgi:hypothetical protein
MIPACNARDADIRHVVDFSQRAVRDPGVQPLDKVHCATLLVLLDIRSFLDRSETALINLEASVEHLLAEARAKR